jgi:SAM-dependent methyltransferase
MQVHPLPSAEELAAYYRAYAYDCPRAWEVAAAVQSSLAKLVTSLQLFRQTKRFLDVGCGAGHLLQAAREQGWDVMGTELSHVAVERLRDAGFSVTPGSELQPDHEPCDVITMIEVIEHVRDPSALCQQVFQCLRNGGALYLTTPNIASLSFRLLKAKWRVIEVPEHLFYFSPRSIRALLTRLGFREITIKTEGISPVEILRSLTRATTESGQNGNSTAALRDAAFNYALIGMVKRIVNQGLRCTSMGDTLKVLAVK